MHFPDQLIAEDMVHACRHEAISYAMMATEASDEEMKQIFLAMHTEAQKQHSQIYNYMKNRGWYPQEAGDLTVSGGWSGEFYPHGQGQRQPVDQPDKAWGKSTWEAHNTPRYENHYYSQEHERQHHQGQQQGSPWGYAQQGIQEAYTRGPGGGLHHDHSRRDNPNEQQGERYR